MSIRRLSYFVAAAEEENFGRAARRMNIAASALARQIHGIEDKLGVILFDRVGRRVTLTKAGEAYLARVKQAQELLQLGAEEAVRIGTTGQQNIVIAVHEGGGYDETILASIRHYRDTFPEFHLSVEVMGSSTQVNAILDRSIDAGLLCNRPPAHPLLDHMTLMINAWCIAMPDNHPLAAKDVLHLADLQAQDFVFLDPETVPQSFGPLFEACSLRGFEPRIVRRARSTMEMLGMVAAGMGITFFCEPSTHPGHVVIRPIADFDLAVPLDLVWLNRPLRPALRAFIDTVSLIGGIDRKKATAAEEIALDAVDADL